MSDDGATTLQLTGVSAAPGRTAVLRGVDLTVPAGTTTTVVGPSGAGKTTLLRVVAGLEPATTGSVLLGDRDLTTVPAHRRGVGVVFQEPRLLPHRTVAGNVAFGLEAAGLRRSAIADVVDRVLGAVGLAGLGDRGVLGLSGGEQQRVNLARALALDPPLLLLDEPLAAVDPERRAELRTLIATVTSSRTTLHVTHDLAEAAQLGDDLGVLLAGRLVQHDRPRRVLERPRNVEVARFVGATNVVAGTVRDGSLCIGPVDGPPKERGGCVLPDVGGRDGPACVAVRPEHVVIGAGPLTASVVTTSYRGTHTRVSLTLADGQAIDADVPVVEAPRPGDSVIIDLRGAHRLDDIQTTEPS